jgi:hypothetical protein
MNKGNQKVLLLIKQGEAADAVRRSSWIQSRAKERNPSLLPFARARQLLFYIK